MAARRRSAEAPTPRSPPRRALDRQLYAECEVGLRSRRAQKRRRQGHHQGEPSTDSSLADCEAWLRSSGARKRRRRDHHQGEPSTDSSIADCEAVLRSSGARERRRHGHHRGEPSKDSSLADSGPSPLHIHSRVTTLRSVANAPGLAYMLPLCCHINNRCGYASRQWVLRIPALVPSDAVTHEYSKGGSSHTSP